MSKQIFNKEISLINFFEFVEDKSCCLVKKLNNKIFVAKLCNSDMINEFYKNIMSTKISGGDIYFDPNYKLFVAFIPKDSLLSDIFVNFYCCKITMEEIYSKIYDYGLAIEGCFNIEESTMLPAFFQGNEFGTKNILTTKSNETIKNLSYLVVDNHKIIKIMSDAEFRSYKSQGVVIQYMQGLRLFENGEPFIGINDIKNVEIFDEQENIQGIPGSNVTIDYSKLKTFVGKKEFRFSEIGKKFKFVHEEMFNIKKGLLVVAIDSSENLFIVYHKHIDMYNVIMMLKLFNCRDAIGICDSSNAHIIWKESGLNTYNKTDFIGNPLEIVSNIVTFAG